MSAVHPSSPSPMFRLVLFMICISVAGTFLGGLHYYAVDLPEQADIPAPANNLCPASVSFATCAKYGEYQCYQCILLGESAYGCEISGQNAMQICTSPYVETCQDVGGGLVYCS